MILIIFFLGMLAGGLIVLLVEVELMIRRAFP